MNEYQTIQTLLENMEHQTRSNGQAYICLKHGAPEWQEDIVYAAHIDCMPSDDIYERIYDILTKLTEEADEDADIDDMYDIVREMDLSDIYTWDLTGWLASHNGNVYYLSEALDAFSVEKDGFNLLRYAQLLYIQEIAEALLSAIDDYIDELSD